MSASSHDGRRVHPVTVLLTCALLVATASVLTVRSVALAADGSFYLVRILGTDEVFSTDARFFANALRQAPVLIAARAGVTNTHILSIVLGIGQIVLPALVWCAAGVLAGRDRLVFAAVALTAGLCLGTTSFLNVGEYVLALALTALVAVLLWRPEAWNWVRTSLAIVASTTLIASYETAAFTGTALALWAGVRAADASERLDRCGSAFVAAASGLSVAVAFRAVVSRRDQSHTQSVLYFVVSFDPWPFYLAFLACAVLIGALAIPFSATARLGALGVGTACAGLAILALTPTPRSAFEARGGAAMAVLALELFLFGHWARRRRATSRASGPRPWGWEQVPQWYVAIAVAFVAGMSYANMQAARTWARSLATFQEAVEANSRPVPVDDALPGDRRLVVWPWTSTSLSLIVRRTPDAGVLVDADPAFVPFPPEAARAQLDDQYVWRP